jgi:patatin-like phospholipase/acyl hydrolase
MSNFVKVLSIDGGGIRGILPASVLVEIEKATGKPTSELFDLIAGTSTGGILTLGLTKPDQNGKPQYTAQDLLELYTTRGKDIFHRSEAYKVLSLDGLTKPKYPADGITSTLEEYFDTAELKDALKPVLVCSYDIKNRQPHFFRQTHAAKDPAHNFYTKHVARATSAAPTYFPAAQITTVDGGTTYDLVDGGVYINNPAVSALTEAMATHGGDECDYLVISLGTGSYTSPLNYDHAVEWGAIGWALNILDLVFDGVSEVVSSQLREILKHPDGIKRFYRFEIDIPASEEKMDDVSPQNIAALQATAQQMINDNSQQLEEVCKLLTS